MRTIHIALKDLLQIFKDKKSLLFLLAMPVAFTAFMGFVLGMGAQDQADPLDDGYTLGLVSASSQNAFAMAVRAALEADSRARLVDYQPSDFSYFEQQLKDKDLAAVILLTQDLQENTGLAYQRVEVMLGEDSAQNQVLQPILNHVLQRVLSSWEIAHLSANDPRSQAEGFLNAWQAWQRPRYTLEVVPAAAGGQDTDIFNNPYKQSSPGMIVMFAIFSLTSSSLVFVQERKTGALQRLMTTSLARTSILAGHMLAMFLLGFAQALILAAAGQLLFGVDYLRQPLAVISLAAVLAFWVSAMGLLIGTVARSEDQATMISLAAMFLFAALGGTWFPLEITGETFSTIGKMLPSGWAMTGFQNILVRGLDFSSVLPALGGIFGYGILFFLLAVWRFRIRAA